MYGSAGTSRRRTSRVQSSTISGKETRDLSLTSPLVGAQAEEMASQGKHGHGHGHAPHPMLGLATALLYGTVAAGPRHGVTFPAQLPAITAGRLMSNLGTLRAHWVLCLML